MNLTPQDFEKVVDVFEKFVFLGESQSRENLVSKFLEKVPKDVATRIPRETLEYIYQRYWKDEREKRKRSFLRKFWEKADFDDNDPFSAFRKRQKERMKLRKKTKYEIDSYLKMFEIRENSMLVLSTLQDIFRREMLKQKENLVDQAAFESKLETTLRERGSNITLPKATLVRQLELKKLDAKLDTPPLKLQIPLKKDYHKNFHRYLPQEKYDELYPPAPILPPKPFTPIKDQQKSQKQREKVIDPSKIHDPQNLTTEPTGEDHTYNSTKPEKLNKRVRQVNNEDSHKIHQEPNSEQLKTKPVQIHVPPSIQPPVYMAPMPVKAPVIDANMHETTC